MSQSPRLVTCSALLAAVSLLSLAGCVPPPGPGYAGPGYATPAYPSPGYADPNAYVDPNAGAPAYADPGYAAPGYAAPVYVSPGYGGGPGYRRPDYRPDYRPGYGGDYGRSPQHDERAVLRQPERAPPAQPQPAFVNRRPPAAAPPPPPQQRPREAYTPRGPGAPSTSGDRQ